MEHTELQPIASATVFSAEGDLADYHRRWFLIDDAGNWLTASRAPGLAQLQLQLRFGFLVIRAPGMLRLDIPLDVLEDDPSVERTALLGGQPIRAVDEGDLAAAWFGDWLGVPCRLLKVHPEQAAFDWP